MVIVSVSGITNLNERTGTVRLKCFKGDKIGSCCIVQTLYSRNGRYLVRDDWNKQYKEVSSRAKVKAYAKVQQ